MADSSSPPSPPPSSSPPDDKKTPAPGAISDICHDGAQALETLGKVIPKPAGPIVAAVGAVVEVACDVYDLAKGLEPDGSQSPAGPVAP